MAFRIAGHNDVLLPVMVNPDGFSLSHSMQLLDTVEPGDFIPRIHDPHTIDPKRPAGYEGLTGPEQHFKFRWDIERPVRNSVKAIKKNRKGLRNTIWKDVRIHRGLPVR